MEQKIYPVQTENVCYEYEDADRLAVDHVNLTVEKGSFVAVLGHNGSGKSTLAKMMNALFLPTDGRVLVCGLDTSEEEQTWTVRRHAGMVFQNPDNQIVANVVREDVAFGLENLGVPQPEMMPRIEAALEAVRMSHRADFAPHMLSGGQKQRVAVAGVLAMQPEVMILDEATAMLDPAGRADVLKTVRRLNREQGMTVLWITLFMEEAAQADRVVVMNKGQVAMFDTVEKVFARSREIEEMGLAVPQVSRVFLSLSEKGWPVPSNVYTTDQAVKAMESVLKGGKQNA